MDTANFIDIYCERTAAGFWNEPVNALTNLAFIIAALLAWPTAWKRPRRGILELTVIALVGIIGVGSFLFHTLATPLSGALDVIPIWLFFFSYILLLFVRVTHGKVFDTIGYMVATLFGFVLITYLASLIGSGDGPAPLNGSLQYAPAMVAMALGAVVALWKKHPAGRYFAFATAVFVVSIFFRSIDEATCSATAGLGTHFLWHILNAVVLGTLLQAAVKTLPPRWHDIH
ncbi:ceramidase domain-containing protein [Martelella mediterranea]|uniref:Ceramidase n=1 Tax=Martelella mediterranea TaxID=293089 RepID=A0A4R3NV48_9HYPH|nr:ceramidase domain-containing protein [Martelella mediterranea]TCT41819.1 ceramidase [Martelella mediterranea]